MKLTGKIGKKKLVQGVDYHAWAWKSDELGWFHWALHDKTTATYGPGKWCRVKFTEVKHKEAR